MSEFKAVDAFEYVEAYQTTVVMPKEAIEGRILKVRTRIATIIGSGDEVPSYIYAAYCGYRDALAFNLNPRNAPSVVQPTQEALA